MCFLGLLGIVLMLIECELTFHLIDHKSSTFSLLVKSTLTFTTLILVGLVFYYHRIDLNLYCVDNSIDDWRIALTRKKMFLIMLEIFICLVHPIPGHFIVEWGSQYVKKVETHLGFFNPYQSSQGNSTVTPKVIIPTTNATDMAQPYVPIDVMLSIPSKWEEIEMFRKTFPCSISVFSFVSRLPFDYASFTFGSRCFISISWLSQSNFFYISLRYQSLHSTTTDRLFNYILYDLIFHCQLVNACMRLQ